MQADNTVRAAQPKQYNRMGDSEVLMSDKVVQELMGEQGDLIQTGSPAILCTPLPTHWRSNKSLPVAFKVFTFQVGLQPAGLDTISTPGNLLGLFTYLTVPLGGPD